MAERPVVNYNGDYITCYPGSNQHDDGKLNLEFNMARLVTRVSSKNFCTVKPSFELRLVRDNRGFPQIEIGEGQCSINGRDLIMTQKVVIDAPEQSGDFYLAIHLAKDSSGNVLGDEIYGVTKTFKGCYITYYDEKPDPVTDPDILYLGKLTYDGTDITNLEEDEDKYGRLWAEDILAKIKDWKHPDTSRLILQDWIYKVPDWYVSKEGDVIFGPLEFLAGRDSSIDGTSDSHEDIGTGKYGIRTEAIIENNKRITKIDIKGPDVSTTDNNKRLNIIADDKGIQASIGQSILISNSDNNYTLSLSTPNDINVTSNGNISIIGKEKITFGTGFTDGKRPELVIDDNSITATSTINTNGLSDSVTFTTYTVKHTIGKAELYYTNNNLSLLDTNTNYFIVNPNTDFTKSIRVQDHIYLGTSATYGSEPSYLYYNGLKLVNGTDNTTIKAPQAILVSETDKGAYVTVKNSNNSKHSTLYNSGILELYNSSANTQILMQDGSSGYNVSIYKTRGAKTLNIDATTTNITGNLSVVGDVTANKVWNAVYNDLVEFMEKEDYDENIEPGDVVYFTDSGKVTKYNANINSSAIAGVVSSPETYGFALGGEGLEDNQKVPVALSGRVYLKTDAIDFKTGDLVNVDAYGNIYKSEIYNRFTLGMVTKSVENNKVFIMIK